MSTMSSSSSNTYIPDYQQSPFLLDLANYTSNLGKQYYNWAQNQYQNTSNVTGDVVNNFLDASHASRDLANNQLDRYQNLYEPLENQAISDAQTYASEPRIRSEMGAAESGVGQGFDAARKNLERKLESFGINPSDGRYAGMERESLAERGAAQAGAGRAARVNAENVGRSLRDKAIGYGQQLPASVVNALNSRQGALSGAENSILSNLNTGVNALGKANDFLGTASKLQYPPLGHNQSQSSSGMDSAGSGSGGSGSGDRYRGDSSGSGGRGGGGSDSQSTYDSTSRRPDSGNALGSGAYNMYQPSAMVQDLTQNPYWQQWQADLKKEGGGTDLSGPQYPPDDLFDEPYSGTNFPPDDTFSDPYGPAENMGGGQGDADYDYSSGGDYSNSVGGYSSGGGDYGGYGGGGGSYDYGGDYGGYSNNYGGGGDWTDSSGQSTDFNYAEGGAIPDNATTGGFVSQDLSPSQGQATDDVPARLNANEFVIPKDVALWKGQEFFQKLIEGARKARGAAPAKPQMKQALPQQAPQQGFADGGGVGGGWRNINNQYDTFDANENRMKAFFDNQNAQNDAWSKYLSTGVPQNVQQEGPHDQIGMNYEQQGPSNWSWGPQQNFRDGGTVQRRRRRRR